MGGDLFQFFVGIGGEKGDPLRVGPGDIADPFDRVAERHMRRVGTGIKAQRHFGTRGGVEMRAELDQTVDDFDSRIRLDRIMDVGVTEARLERVILGFDPVHVQHQRRFIEFAAGKVGGQTIGGGVLRQGVCDRGGHQHLQKTRP